MDERPELAAASSTETPRPLLPLPSGNDPALLAGARDLGWNWGGFFMPYLWLIGHGRLSLAMLLWLSASLPFIGALHLIIYPVTAFYLGFNGYELAWRYQPYHSLEQLHATERSWTLWGVVFVVLLLLGTLLFFSYMGWILQEAGDLMDAYGG
jgi:hypothetical protein